MSAKPNTNVKQLQRHFLQEQERAQRAQISQQNTNVGKFNTDEIEETLDSQLNQSYDKSNVNKNVSKMEQARIDAMEQEAKAYEQQRLKEEYDMKNRRSKMEHLMQEEINRIIGNSEWNKSKIQRWMQEIIDSTGEVLDQFLSNLGVFKYSIDVIILKSTAVAKQSEHLMSPQTDYSFNIKVKNGCGIIVLLNTHAFKVANI